MKRIFLTLSIFSTLLLTASFVLGLNVEDVTPDSRQPPGGISLHMLTALGSLCFTSLVHALWLTYFMGTGRWMEETCRAYALPEDFQKENRSLKYGTIPAIMGAFLLLLLTGGLGAAVDPGSSVDFRGWGSLSGPVIHFLSAAITLGANAAVHVWEYATIAQNHALIQRVMAEVRRIRTERGLPV